MQGLRKILDKTIITFCVLALYGSNTYIRAPELLAGQMGRYSEGEVIGSSFYSLFKVLGCLHNVRTIEKCHFYCIHQIFL